MFWQTLGMAAIGLAGAALVVRPFGRAGALAYAALTTAWGLLLAAAISPVTGVVPATAGIATALVRGLAETRAEEPARRRRTANEEEVSAPFRLVAAALGAVLAYGLARTVPFQPGIGLSGPSWAWYWSTIAALIVLLLGRNLARSAYGLLLLCFNGPLLTEMLSPRDSVGASTAGAAASLALALLIGVIRPAARESTPTPESSEKAA